jgi:hypothetical protein
MDTRASLGGIAASFPNRPTNGTTAAFTLTAGFGELQVKAVDQNDPGIVTLLDSAGATVATIKTSVGEFPGYTGCAYFVTAGGAYTITNTTPIAQLTVYLQEA